ncbi:prosaposin [Cinnamomum micranthum f. kanehirae]|uniref:Pulmonary surfactant-associated protein B n=1 Tax=Cinnamomum micranthum f. kanehirae TaxID=337451 RepID=A0A443NKK4_9MAGN|nr:prosaposin [Cinnamomum micranthum f. kanehirae]
MSVSIRLLFLLLLSSNWAYSDARSLVISHVSAMQTNYEDPRSKTLEVDVGNERLCTYCEQFTAQAIYYLSENKTQSEIVEALHHTCSRLRTFHKECDALVDYYAPLFFVEIAMIKPEDFCKKVNLCEDAGFISPQIYGDSCSVCHEAVVEVLLKLKDPDTQCKKLVFEYGPLIMANAERFLEKHDVCVSLHVCKDSGIEAGSNSPLLDITSA